MKIISKNRRAGFEFELLERFEAGLALVGSEVKSLRDGHASIAEAYAAVQGEEVFILGMNIPPYDPASHFNHEPTRPRKLLLHRREIRRLTAKVSEKGLTLIPTKLYFTDRGLAKIEVALARGKKLYDKRQALRDRDERREIARSFGHDRRG